MDVVNELAPNERAIVITEQAQLKLPDGSPAYPLSDVVTCDAHTALTRGLASYLSQLSIIDVDGAEHKLAAAFDTYAEPEDDAVYPLLSCYGVGAGTYEPTGFTPAMLGRQPLVTRGERGKYIYSPHELALPVLAEVWAENPGDRQQIAAMIETGSVPALFTSALRLVLPYYFNQTCSFELKGVEYVDDAVAAQRRYRKLRILYTGNVPVTRWVEAGKAKLRVQGEVGTDDDF